MRYLVLHDRYALYEIRICHGTGWLQVVNTQQLKHPPVQWVIHTPSAQQSTLELAPNVKCVVKIPGSGWRVERFILISIVHRFSALFQFLVIRSLHDLYTCYHSTAIVSCTECCTNMCEILLSEVGWTQNEIFNELKEWKVLMNFNLCK